MEAASTQPRTKLFWFVVIVCVFILTFLGYVFGGQTGATGALLGVFGIGLSMLGTWLAIGWIGKLMKDGSPKWQGSAIPITFMIIKLPAILVTMSWALRLGPPAPSWFLGGLALVYSATVWWCFLRK